MRVSSVLLSALVAFGAVAVAPLAAVSAASQSPAQTKIDTLKSLIESQAGVNPAPVCEGAAVATTAPQPPQRPGQASPPSHEQHACAACQVLVGNPNLATCEAITDGNVKTACKTIQPYFTACGNQQVLDNFNAKKIASAQLACSTMKNGAPHAHGKPFCKAPSLVEVATKAESAFSAGTPCDMCQKYVRASRATRDVKCVQAFGLDKCFELKKAVESAGTAKGTKKSTTESIASICELVPMTPNPAHKGQKHYCTPSAPPSAPHSASRAPSKASPSAASPQAPKKKSFLESTATVDPPVTSDDRCLLCKAYLNAAEEIRKQECEKEAKKDTAKAEVKLKLCTSFDNEFKSATSQLAKYEKNGCFVADDFSYVQTCPVEAICTFVKDGGCTDNKYVRERPADAPSVPFDAVPGAFLEGQTLTRAEAECSMCQLITTVSAKRRADLCASHLIAEAQKDLCRSVYQGVYLKNEAAFKEVDHNGCWKSGQKVDVCPAAAVCAMIGAQCPSSEANGFSLKQQGGNSNQNTNNQNKNASNNNQNQNQNQGNKNSQQSGQNNQNIQNTQNNQNTNQNRK